MPNFLYIDANSEESEHNTVASPTTGTLATNYTSATPAGNDLTGNITVVTGATAPVAGAVCNVTFTNPFAKAPASIQLTGQLGAYPTAITANGFTLNFATAPAVSSTYTVYYAVPNYG